MIVVLGEAGVFPITATIRFISERCKLSTRVTSYLPTSKPGTVTACWGRSLALLPASVDVDPIVNVPLSTLTISG